MNLSLTPPLEMFIRENCDSTDVQRSLAEFYISELQQSVAS